MSVVASDVSDVFISYRRKNVDFTKQLVAELQAAGKEVWIDWEDIPPGSVGFADDIKRGLEGADAFICVLSPDYLESTYCVDMELGYALQLKKKIIPIVLEKFEGKPIPEGIGHINWIYFTPHAGQQNNFENALPLVLQALDQDLDHARFHKKLALRALEWDENARNISYLLNGEEIIEAESWITRSVEKAPIPTELHGDYVIYSRQQHIRRQRQILITVTTSLVIAVIMGCIAFLLYREAEEQRQRAERRTEVAVSLAMANDAQIALRDGLPDRALALANQSTDIDSPPLSSRTIYGDVVNNSGTRHRFTGHTDQVLDVTYHPFEQIVATASGDRTLRIWDATTGSTITTLDAHSDWVTAVAFSPNGDRLFSGSGNGEAIIWDTQTWEEVLRFDGHALGFVSASFNAAGDQLLTAGCIERDAAALCIDSDIAVWSAETGENLLVFELFHAGAVNKAAFSEDGTRALSAGEDTQVIYWDASTGTPILQLQMHTEPVFDVTFVPGELQALSASGDKFVILWDLETGEMIRRYVGHEGRVLGIDVTADGTRFATASEDTSIIIWDTQTGADLQRYAEHTSLINDVAFSPDDSMALSGSQDADARLWDLESGNNLRTFDDSPWWVVHGLGITSDESMLLTGDMQGNVTAWEISEPGQQSVLYQLNFADQIIMSLAISPDDSYTVLGFGNGDILRIDTQSGEELNQWNAHDGTFIRALNVLPDGERVLSCGEDNNMALWNAEDGELIREYTGHENWVLFCKINEAGTHALSASSDFNVGYWDIESAELIHMMEGHDDFVWAVDFNADNTQAISASRDQTLIRWDLERGEQLDRLENGHSSAVTMVRYAPDERYALSGSRDTNIVLWDLAQGVPVQTLQGHEETVWGMHFSADGERLFSGASDTTVREWQLNYDMRSLKAWAANVRYTRTPTDLEAAPFDSIFAD